MSMQLRFTHTTEFTYDGKAVASFNQARLTPLTNPEQIVVHSRLEVLPHPWTYEYRDYFGSLVTSFEVMDPHDEMTVRATCTVQTNRHRPGEPTTTWEELAAREICDRWTEFLTVPALVAPPEDFARRVRAIREESALPGEAARRVCALIDDEVEYVPGSTDVQSVAEVAWRQRSGVCQDMVHLAIGGLRSIGIPARYVSGYFHPQVDPVVGETVIGESHAWVEWWDNGWESFDVTNNAPISDRYVEVAVGRDYQDVKPLSGIFSGAAATGMTVRVEVTRLA